MKKNNVLRLFLVSLCAFFMNAGDAYQVVAADFFFSNGPFSIRIANRQAPAESGPVHVAPPAFYHPSASIYFEPGYVDRATASEPRVPAASTPRSVVYGPEYRTAPYLSAPPDPVGHVRPIPQPRTVAAVHVDSSPWPGPFPTRPNNFRPNPYFGPGPHLPGPNHFGGMTPLGPGPYPAFGPH